MKNKTILQIFLLILLILISFLTFSFYLKKNIKTDNIDNVISDNSENNENVDNEGNLIENISYISTNTRGDTYQILADFGETNTENSDLMFLTNVKAKIILKDKENVNLTSDFANFNSKTFETTFIDNVKISRKDQIITGNELYLVLDHDSEDELENMNSEKKEKNLLRMSNNILLQKPGSTLKADVIEIDLVTKNLKVYMIDEIEKVNIKTEIK